MVFSIDMRRIKRDSYLIIRKDGLSDICAGLMLGIMAIFFLDFKYAGELIVGCSMQTIILPICRNKFTYPRVGYAKFSGHKDRKNMIIRDIAVPLIIVGLIICIGIWLRPLLPLCLGTFLGYLAFVGARITEYFLDYIFAAVFVISGFIGLLLIYLGFAPGLATAYQLWGLSVIFIPVGLVQFIRFIQKHPQSEKEAFYDNTN